MTENEIIEKLNERCLAEYGYGGAVGSENFTRMELPYVQTVIYTTRKDKTDGQQKKFYVNCETSERGFDLDKIIDMDKPYKLIRRGSNTFSGYAFGYDEELDLLVIFLAEIDTHMPMKGARRRWHIYCQMYVDRDKNVYYKSYDSRYHCGHDIEECDTYDFLKMKGENCIVPLKSREPEVRGFLPYDHADMEAVWKIFPKIVTLEANRTYYMNSAWLLRDFLRYKEPSVKDGPKPRTLSRLLEHSLADLSSYQEVSKKAADAMQEKYGAVADARIAVLERVDGEDQPVVCLRKLYCCNRIEGNMPHEYSRIYFIGKTAIACKSDNRGGFVYMPMYDNVSYWGNTLVDYDPSITKGTMLEYFSSILETVPDDMKEFYIWALIKTPVLEKLWKAGYDAYVRNILYRSNTSSPKKMLEFSFGKINERKKGLHDIVGFNKYQLDVLLNMECNTRQKRSLNQTVQMIKRAVGADRARFGRFFSVKDVNPRIFDAVVDIYEKIWGKADELKNRLPYQHGSIDARFRRLWSGVELICSVWGPSILPKAKESILLFCDYLEDEAERDVNWLTYAYQDKLKVFMDYVGMVRDMGATSSNKPYFKSMEELQRLHDNAVTIFNIKKDVVQSRRISELSERVGKYEYEDDDYCVITPSCSEDFLREGQQLNHCVAHYVERVAWGETNIMFIRKKDKLNKPFFTVEISDRGCIEQIHGFDNRDLDTEPDLIPFVEKWQKERGVSVHNINKIR